jgi:hypothetical protein
LRAAWRTMDPRLGLACPDVLEGNLQPSGQRQLSPSCPLCVTPSVVSTEGTDQGVSSSIVSIEAIESTVSAPKLHPRTTHGEATRLPMDLGGLIQGSFLHLDNGMDVLERVCGMCALTSKVDCGAGGSNQLLIFHNILMEVASDLARTNSWWLAPQQMIQVRR